jgi:DNA invertase Pin-like site-specific DNA recombinase
MPKSSNGNLAAQYVRMSTEHQRYSIDNQIEAIRQYADIHGYLVTRTYADAGRSGLQVKNRPGLRRLIADVECGEADYQTIMVYDVSRWGRFQDTDEAAYYEHLCRRHGISVTYCGEAFESYGGALADIAKAVKRFMAAEFSRDLSRRTFNGQARIAGLGFHVGGSPGFGFRRLLVSEEGEPKMRLRQGEVKAVHTDRVKLIPGPRREVRLVREIYDLYLDGGTFWGIARQLNERGERPPTGRRWDGGCIKAILAAPRNVGEVAFNQTSKKLGGRRVKNPPDQWIRAQAWEGIVPRAIFERAQSRLADQPEKLDNEELLSRLRELLAREGRLTGGLINADPRLPGPSLIADRFGALGAAYSAVGFEPRGVKNPNLALASVAALRAQITQLVLARLRAAGHQPTTAKRRIKLYGRSYAVITVAPDRTRKRPTWRRLAPVPGSVDLAITLRLTEDCRGIEDFWLLPRPVLETCFNLTPGQRLWNTMERYSDADSMADALEGHVQSLLAPESPTAKCNGTP